MLEIKNVTITVDNKTILDKLSLTIKDGEICCLMGPNGTGKSTICKVLMRHPDYAITKGEILYNNEDISKLNPTDMGRNGMFLLNQNPIEIEGITNAELLRNVLSEKTGEKVDIFKFNKRLNEVCSIINMPKEFVHRDINYNMSGGEKKKNELLHLFILEPNFIILDEIDSGLDIDAIKTVGEALRKYYDEYKPSILIITHHADILKYFDEFNVAVLEQGRIIKTGDKSLVKLIENDGFKAQVLRGNDENE